jgi:hypothetical protein
MEFTSASDRIHKSSAKHQKSRQLHKKYTKDDLTWQIKHATKHYAILNITKQSITSIHINTNQYWFKLLNQKFHPPFRLLGCDGIVTLGADLPRGDLLTAGRHLLRSPHGIWFSLKKMPYDVIWCHMCALNIIYSIYMYIIYIYNT